MRKEMEGKRILPPSRLGFREGTGTMDNIYVLNEVVNRRVVERKGKMVVLFVDIKAAFDSMDREVLMEGMRKRGGKGRASGKM